MMANWTFAVDLCHTIPKDKNIDDKEQCPQNTNVCGIKREHKPGESDDTVRKVVPIAGAYTFSNGQHQDVKPTRLKNSESNSAADTEGLRLEMFGGMFPFNDQKDSTKQKAIIELICSKDMEGWEPSNPPTKKSEKLINRDEGKDDNSHTKALKVISYKDEAVKDEVFGVLRLEWQTKHACEDAILTPGNDGASTGWGFFTWLIIMYVVHEPASSISLTSCRLFMAIAAYIIMGAWLNYTKYGARGVDLLPHSDTLRDIPYIIKDMLRRLHGGTSRGGYSAV